MGLSSKHVSGDQPLDWGQTFRQPDSAEPPKPPPAGRQPPQQAETLKCPRCSSTNTKFCYYNNYNKSQPRHFCKSCKRHWTKGGTLRNVPVGGGRKNKRPKLSKPAAPAAAGAALPIRDFSSFPQKNMSNIFLQTGSTPAGAAAAPQRSVQNTEFQFSGLSTFDVNSSVYHQPFDQFGGNLDAAEESTVTTVNMAGSSGGAWDLPSYWNWSDIDVLTSGDLSVTWDDQENAVIKP